MFNIGDLLSRAWNILWRYRVLWIFALLLAISGGAGGGGGGCGGGGGGASGTANLPTTGSDWFDGEWGSWNVDQAMPQWLQEAVTWFEDTITPMFATEERAIRSAFTIVAVIIGISLLVGLLLALVRYPSETAVIRLVDDYARTGNKVTFREGWRLGWDGRAWRLFLVDLLIGTPAFAIIVVLIGAMGLLVWRLVEGSSTNLSPAAIAGLIIISLFFLAFILFMVLVSLLRQYVARFVTLENLRVGEAFKRGWQMFKGKFWATVVLGLVQTGLGIAFGFAAMIAFFLLIPAYAVLAVPGALVAALPGGLAYLLSSLSVPTAIAVSIAVLVALPFFVAVVFLPVSFFAGMFGVYTSNIWTLAFRTLHPIGTPPPVSGEIPPAQKYEVPPPLEGDPRLE